MSYRLLQAVVDMTGIPMSEKAVLVVLARYADDDGANVFPSVETVAEKAGMNERTVRRSVTGLEGRGLVKRLTKAGGRGKSNRYVIVINSPEKAGVESGFSGKADSVSIKAGATPADSIKEEIKEEGDARAPACEGFDEFWEAYPKKVAVADAAEAFAEARQRATLAEIMHGVGRYAADRQGKDSRYTANPANWLKGNRWADEIPTPGTESFHEQQYRPQQRAASGASLFTAGSKWAAGILDRGCD